MEASPPPFGPRLIVGDWLVDPSLDLIRRGDTEVKLEPRKMQLLMALARRPGELVATDELHDTVWKDSIVSPSSIYQSIAQLRKTLGDSADAPTYIVTVPRKGYRLVATVAPAAVTGVAAAAPPPPAASGAEAPRATVRVPPSLPSPARRIAIAGVAAALTIASGLGLWRWRRAIQPAASHISIAVLPFDDLSAHGLGQALADGLAEEITGALGRHPQILVVARESAFTFRKTTVAVQDIGGRLMATHVLRGEFFRGKERMRLSLRLFDGGDGELVWRDDLEWPSGSIAEIPYAVATAVTQALGLPAAAAGAQAPSALAYEMFLLGRHAMQPLTPEAIRNARDYFQRAIDIDAGFALAYAAQAMTWIAQSEYGSGLSLREAAARAMALLDKALALEPDSVEALAAQGYSKTKLAQYEEGRRDLERALALRPTSAQANLWMGINLASDGWPVEALRYYTRAADADPLAFIVPTRAGLESTFAGRYDDAERNYARAIKLAPHHPNPYWGLGILGFARGRLDEAVAGYRRALEANSRRADLWNLLGWLYLDAGLAAEARRAFEQAISLGAAAVYRAAAAHVFIVEGDLPGLGRYLDEHGLPPPAANDVAITCSLFAVMLDRPERARRLIDAAVPAMLADPVPLYNHYLAFYGQHPLLDIATVYVALGDPAAAQPFLLQAREYLDRHEQRGNVWASFGYHRARIAALQGEPAAALTQLERAVDKGWRRGWWLRADPALRAVRADARFERVLARIDADVTAQRARIAT